MSHPIPCAHCGVNFMRHNLSPDYPKICNSCMLKEKQHKKGNVENMNMVKLLVEVDRQTQVEIEEICINEGISQAFTFSCCIKNLKQRNQLKILIGKMIP